MATRPRGPRRFRLLATGVVLLGVLAFAMPAGPTGVRTAAAEEVTAEVHETNRYEHLGGATYRVYGYQEGLVGYTTANGHVIQENDHFVALPCFCVLSSQGGNEFQVKLEYNGQTAIVPVWDVGPWNTRDNYWDAPGNREWQGLPTGYPAAAAAYYDNYNGGLDQFSRTVGSPGGIDIADGTFFELGMKGSDWVTVTFLWLEPERWDIDPPLAPYQEAPTVWWDERAPVDGVGPIASATYTYFGETGHNVPSPLVQWYWANGGVARFGYPVSEFYREVNIDGVVRYVQIFERTMLTYDWTTDGGATFSTVPLGYRSHIDPGAATQIAEFLNTPTSRYFPETAHSLQNGFKAFWEAHDGPNALGAPLSEEWSETRYGRKVVMQMFEHGRLEWWPDKVGTGEEITRGLLGVEMISALGWNE